MMNMRNSPSALGMCSSACSTAVALILLQSFTMNFSSSFFISSPSFFTAQYNTGRDRLLLQQQPPSSSGLKHGKISQRSHACTSLHLASKTQSLDSVPFNTPPSSSSSYQILYQKVLRLQQPSQKSTTIQLSLPKIIDYLQNDFTLPNVHIPFEAFSIFDANTDQQEDSLNINSPAILYWDSSLSPSPHVSRLYVEVVAICPNTEEDRSSSGVVTSSYPTMAMVIVKRRKYNSSDSSSSSLMIQNLITDSQQKIVKALDKSLIELEQGGVFMNRFKRSSSSSTVGEKQKRASSSILQEDISTNSKTTASQTNLSSTSSVVEDDYAIAAARKVMAQQTSIPTRPPETISTTTTVQEEKKPISKKTTKSKTSKTKTFTPKEEEALAPKKASKKTSNFRVSISKPKDFNALSSKNNTITSIREEKEPKESSSVSAATAAAPLNKKRNIYLQVDDSSIDLEQPLTRSRNDSITLPSKEEDAIWKVAMEMMPTVSDNESLTPQQIWENVIQFGEESKKQELDGQGFVQGVLEKTKELLLKQPSKDPKVRETAPGVAGMMTTAEEELKKIFAAGEQIIEGKMISSSSRSSSSRSPSSTATLSSTESSSSSRITEEYIDELIDMDTTVSKNVKSLDEELAELEIRVSRTVGERSYDTGPNPVFDAFSGPREYNPNVDPETAVNWPGAPLGTRTDVRLPPELANAMKQAQFAAEALAQLREVEEYDDDGMRYFIGSKQVTKSQVDQLRFIVEESVSMGLISDPIEFLAESSRLQMIFDEMKWQPDERFDEIVSNYRDVLLSDNFPNLIRNKLTDMARKESQVHKAGGSTLEMESIHQRERETMSRLVNYAQLLLKEAQALGAELENNQLEVIRSICLVAMDPQHTTEEETSMALADAVRDMRPLLDENFVAYLKYAISEEEANLARKGVLDDPEHNRWLFVLKIVQEGVYAELAKSIRRYIDHISYVLRMETKADRRALLSKLIDVMPSLDVRPFVKCVDNIAASLGSAVKGEFSNDILGAMANKVLQLRRDVHELLPQDRIKLKSQDADEWVERQRQKLLERRNASLQRLQAGKDTEKYDDDELFRHRGDVERMT